MHLLINGRRAAGGPGRIAWSTMTHKNDIFKVTGPAWVVQLENNQHHSTSFGPYWLPLVTVSLSIRIECVYVSNELQTYWPNLDSKHILESLGHKQRFSTGPIKKDGVAVGCQWDYYHWNQRSPNPRVLVAKTRKDDICRSPDCPARLGDGRCLRDHQHWNQRHRKPSTTNFHCTSG